MMRCRSRKGFSLVEVVVSVLIVGMLFVASLATVSASRVAQVSLADRSRGYQLAMDLMSEIQQKPYTDPFYLSSMGPGSDEVATGNRSLFDDADDYLNWTASPPQQSDGTTISGFEGWTRQVNVEWIDPADTSSTGTSSDGGKRITVTVLRGQRVVAQVVAIRTNAYTSLMSGGL